MIPIVCFVGQSGVGKTTLLERIIVSLRKQGLRVAAIKHAAHGFEMDKPGKDSWRLSQVGCTAVILSSPHNMALIQQAQSEPTLDELASMLQDKADIILAEGYKNSDKPKIEVFRSGVSKHLLSNPEELLAIVSDQSIPLNVPQFAFTEVDRMADLIVRHATDNGYSPIYAIAPQVALDSKVYEVRWKKWTPKSGKIQRRRCQNERDSARKVHEGVSRGSSETGNGRGYVITGGRPSVVFGAIDDSDLGEGI